MKHPRTRVAVIDVVALSRQMMEHMPQLSAWAEGRSVSSFPPAFPALTCSAQSTYVTGLSPREHAIPGNGWYNRNMCEIQFWKQSNKLVQGPRLWEKLRERYGSGFTCAKLFWWYNMYSTADWTITPRPMYPADGRKIFDIYTQPMELRETIKKDLGEFPFPTFWGPMAGIQSSQWIADSARWVERKHRPDLSLIYLPYLDYDLQKFGPSSTQAAHAAKAMDGLLCDLIDFLEREGVTPVVLSEYGISDVSRSIALNRLFREQGWITVKPEMGTEMLDCGASRAFAVADHQTAHIYINDPSVKEEVKALLSATPGVEEIRETDFSGLSSAALERLPEFTAVAAPDAWFTCYYWLDDTKAPDFARCVDIHRKPGYDPSEMFFDPGLTFPMFHAASFLLKKKLGFRALMKVIPLNGDQVKGSHGRDRVPANQQPVFIGPAFLPEIHAAADGQPPGHECRPTGRECSRKTSFSGRRLPSSARTRCGSIHGSTPCGA